MHAHRFTPAVLGLLALALVGCGPPVTNQRKLIANAFQKFSSFKEMPTSARVWLTNQDDNECNYPPTSNGAPGALISVSGHVNSAPMTPYDAVTYEIFSNVITDKKWGQLIEAHRHNYATDLKAQTRRSVEMGTKDAPRTTMSSEDLCMLDEAKKRNADYVLVYQVLNNYGSVLFMNLRLSNAHTGIVELAKTLRSDNRAVSDISY